MPASAEMIAAIAGTRGAWITTQQTHTPAAGLLAGLGSRSRGREYVIHPDTIKGLDVGEVAVIEPRRRGPPLSAYSIRISCDAAVSNADPARHRQSPIGSDGRERSAPST